MSIAHRIAQHGTTNPDAPDIPFEPFGAARRNGEEIESPAAFLKKKCPQLRKWLLEIFRHDIGIDASITLRDRTEKGEKCHFSISMWGHKHEYVLSVNVPSGKMVPKMVRHRARRHGYKSISLKPSKKAMTLDTGYMGLGSVARAPYAGEQHRRGSDMYDGSFSEKTWRMIKDDILRDSLVELHDWARTAAARRHHPDMRGRKKRGGHKRHRATKRKIRVLRGG